MYLAAVKFDVGSICIEIKEASLKWTLLGIALGVEYADLERIRVGGLKSGDGVDEHLAGLLRHWIKSDANASWDALLDALENTPEQAPLAKKVRAKIFPGEYLASNAYCIP